jgi:hypothetical protein
MDQLVKIFGSLSMLEFNENNVRDLLAKNSFKLYEGGISTIWLDMSGSAWTQAYSVTVHSILSTNNPFKRKQLRDGKMIGTDEIINYWKLTPGNIKLLENILSQLKLPENIALSFVCAQNLTLDIEQAIWPIIHREKQIEKEIAKLQKELDYLKKLKIK